MPLVIVLSICSIIYLNTSSARSLVFAIVINIYVIYLLISTRYASKSERYVLAENKRVKKVLGPGIITDPSIWKCKKVQINLFAPDLVNEKYDFKLKERLNDRLNNEGFL